MRLKKIYVVFGFSLLLPALFSAAQAFPPPRPGIVDPLTGRFRTTGHRVPQAPRESIAPRVSPDGGRVPLSPFAFLRPGAAARPLAVVASDNVARPLVLLIDFADRVHVPAADNLSVERLFFDNTAGAASVANFWSEVSYGKFHVGRPSSDNASNPDVVGWLQAGVDFPSSVTLSGDIAGVQVANVRQLLDNVVAALSARGFDFSPYARPVDGVVQSVILVHPGYGAEDSGDLARDPYSHTATITPIHPRNQPAVTIADYTIVPSAQYYNDPTPGVTPGDDVLVGIGVIVHEMGHLLGLPDLYPTAPQGQTADSYSGVGVYDLMGYGLWGRPFDASVPNPVPTPLAGNPAHLSAWSKIELGWLAPTILSSSGSGRALLPAAATPPPGATTPLAYKVYPNGPGDESQFFLLELRGKDSPAVFDQGLPGNGVLIWRVDNEKMDAWRRSSSAPLLRNNAVNNIPDFLALSVQEGDLDNTASGSIPHLIQPFSIGARALGAAGDFFGVFSQSFSRTSPVDGQNRTNSSPTIDTTSTLHLFDAGIFLTIRNFVLHIAGKIVDAAFDMLADLPYWRVFRTPTINTNNILSFGFDSSNRTWVGTADQGIWIFSLTNWTHLNPAMFRSLRVQAMAFEPRTQSMWVGTDNTLEKVRLDKVIASFPNPSKFPGFPTISARGIVVDRVSRKWIAGGRVLAAIFDPGNNLESDFTPDTYADLTGNIRPALSAGEQITCVAFDNVFSSSGDLDVLYLGTSQGRIFRNATPSGSTIHSLYVPGFVSSLVFEPMDIPVANRPAVVNAMAVDEVGILWVASDRGVFAFDRGDPSTGLPDLFNPFDLTGSSDNATIQSLVYFPFTAPGGFSVMPQGVAFQTTGQKRPIVWVAYGDRTSVNDTAPGWAERIDPNVLLNAAIRKVPVAAPRDAERVAHATMRFTTAAVPKDGPATNNLTGASGDQISNVWFSTNNSGAIRFGSGASITLDKSLYVNTTAIARVSLVDENLAANQAQIRVTSSVDGSGLTLFLERGADNVFRGQFGFSTGGTDNVAPAIGVKNGGSVTVTYRSANPPSTKSATAFWKSVFPFSDSLLIEGFSCFVATAAYGAAAPEVAVLRHFRDAFLLTNRAGSLFTRAYYRLSPPLAAVIAKSPALRFAARTALTPVFLAAGFAVGGGVLEKFAVASLLVLVGGLLLRRGRLSG